jgi:predicted DCC family thiol-disulfide oxidoreductase YuxK
MLNLCPVALTCQRLIGATAHLQPANVLAAVGTHLPTVNGIGTGTMPDEQAVRFAFESDLINVPTTHHVPEKSAANGLRFRIAIGQSITVRTWGTLASWARQRREDNSRGERIADGSSADRHGQIPRITTPIHLFIIRAGKGKTQVGSRFWAYNGLAIHGGSRGNDVREPIVLFDGVCKFCNASVHFIIDHDRRERIHFATLQSSTGQGFLARFGLDTKQFNSLLLVEGQRWFIRSTAALRIARYLDPPWPILSVLLLVPTFLRDSAYDLLAVNRYRWFGQLDACRIPTPEVQRRFLD